MKNVYCLTCYRVLRRKCSELTAAQCIALARACRFWKGEHLEPRARMLLRKEIVG